MVIGFKQINCTAQVENKSEILSEQLGLGVPQNESKHFSVSAQQFTKCPVFILILWASKPDAEKISE
jgi:hypothetical protein